MDGGNNSGIKFCKVVPHISLQFNAHCQQPTVLSLPAKSKESNAIKTAYFQYVHGKPQQHFFCQMLVVNTKSLNTEVIIRVFNNKETSKTPLLAEMI
jgi:hypothetical protein